MPDFAAEARGFAMDEFDVIITGRQVMFSWNSPDISELARMLGQPDMDGVPCG